jgi:hemerythrin
LIVRLSDISTQALKDPFLILFGRKFLNLRLRQQDRDHQDLFKLVNSILRDYVERKKKEVTNPETETKQFKTIIELLMIERQASFEKNEKLYTNDEDLVD